MNERRRVKMENDKPGKIIVVCIVGDKIVEVQGTLEIGRVEMKFARRSEILGIDTKGNFTQVEFNLAQALELVANGFLKVEDRQNEAPSAAEFIAWMQNHPTAIAHGYAIGGDHHDARVSIEGIKVKAKDVTPLILKDFVNDFRFAEDFTIDDDLWCWWD